MYAANKEKYVQSVTWHKSDKTNVPEKQKTDYQNDKMHYVVIRRRAI